MTYSPTIIADRPVTEADSPYTLPPGVVTFFQRTNSTPGALDLVFPGSPQANATVTIKNVTQGANRLAPITLTPKTGEDVERPGLFDTDILVDTPFQWAGYMDSLTWVWDGAGAWILIDGYDNRAPGVGLLYGAANSFTLDATRSVISGYTNSTAIGQFNDADVDPTSGEITIPQTDIYTVRFHVYGNQGNSTKEESIIAGLRSSLGGDADVDVFDVATDKTSGRSVAGSFTRASTAGEALSVYMYATAGLGTFTVLVSDFQVTTFRAG